MIPTITITDASAITTELLAELHLAVDHVLGTASYRPRAPWREAATSRMEQHGLTYEETIRWLSERIGLCGYPGFGPAPSYDFAQMSLSSEVWMFSHALRHEIKVKRGMLLRAVFPDPTKAQQLSLF